MEQARSRRNARIAFFLLHALLLLYGVGILITRRIDPQHTLFFCPVYRFLHLFCPMCGATRAVLSLLSLDFAAALRYSPAAILLLLTLLYYEIYFARAILGKKPVRFRASPLIALGVFAAAFCILRNVLLVTVGYDPTGDLAPYWTR